MPGCRRADTGIPAEARPARLRVNCRAQPLSECSVAIRVSSCRSNLDDYDLGLLWTCRPEQIDPSSSPHPDGVEGVSAAEVGPGSGPTPSIARHSALCSELTGGHLGCRITPRGGLSVYGGCGECLDTFWEVTWLSRAPISLLQPRRRLKTDPQSGGAATSRPLTRVGVIRMRRLRIPEAQGTPVTAQSRTTSAGLTIPWACPCTTTLHPWWCR